MARVPEFRDARNRFDAQSTQALVFGTMKRTGVRHRHGIEYVMKTGEEHGWIVDGNLDEHHLA